MYQFELQNIDLTAKKEKKLFVNKKIVRIFAAISFQITNP